MEMLERIDSPFYSNHLWYNYVSPHGIYCNAGPAFPIIVCFWLNLIYLIIRGPIKRCLRKHGRNKLDYYDDI